MGRGRAGGVRRHLGDRGDGLPLRRNGPHQRLPEQCGRVGSVVGDRVTERPRA
ncbi:hypothetical protein STXM2123_1044 [Streptomyces sp. F-3]|nr:hypothetical protein STXM2123_1044 [Streptomyces sp. F-3]